MNEARLPEELQKKISSSLIRLSSEKGLLLCPGGRECLAAGIGRVAQIGGHRGWVKSLKEYIVVLVLIPV